MEKIFSNMKTLKIDKGHKNDGKTIQKPLKTLVKFEWPLSTTIQKINKFSGTAEKPIISYTNWQNFMGFEPYLKEIQWRF